MAHGSHLAHLGSLRSTFSNLPRSTKTLVTRCSRGMYKGPRRVSAPPVRDARGSLVRRIETAQTFLTPSEVDRLVADYHAGTTVQGLAKKYGIHRATVSAHLSRRNTPRRHHGLDVNEEAEAVVLYREGFSLRAIARRMGVDRRLVRLAIVDAKIEVRDH